MKARLLCVLLFILTTVITDRKMLQIFEGTVTEISCSTTVPSFLISGVYTSQHYHELPSLFGIEAVIALDRSNVTLRINGSSLSDNVTIECQNIIDPVLGHTETLFRFTLVFVATLPPPTNIHLNGSTLLWELPMQLLQSLSTVTTINIDPQISYYMIHVNDLSTNSEILIRTSRHQMFTFPCVYSVQVSAVNSAGVGERSSTTIIDNCAEANATADKSWHTDMEESDYFHNQTFTVYYQEVTPEDKNKTEKFHSGSMAIIVSMLAVVGSIASISLTLNCVLLILLMKKLRNNKSRNKCPNGKCEQKVIMEENEAYACAANLNHTYATVCARY